MAKLYYADEIQELLNKKVNSMIDNVVNDRMATDKQILAVVYDVRILRDFVEEFCDDLLMEEANGTDS